MNINRDNIKLFTSTNISDLTLESNNFIEIADSNKINFIINNNDKIYLASHNKLAWGQKLSIQGRANFSGSGVEEDRRVNLRVLNFPIAENPIFSLAIAKKPHSSCHKSTSSKACPAWHSA